MNVTRDKNVVKCDYYIGKVILENVSLFNELFVIVSKDISWGKHINKIIKKAKSRFGLVKRTISNFNLPRSEV